MSPFDADHMPPATISVRGKERVIDIDDPELPEWVEENALSSGGFPYTDTMKRKDYEEALYDLHVELTKVQYWREKTGARIICLFEGRDAAGKGGSIKAVRENLRPRSTRIVALPAPSDRERGEWYFQRYVQHLPSAGEMALFDRSWYNRAGVEKVMGFCTHEQYERFLREVPTFEHALARDGIYLFKFWLAIGREMQIKRFHDRRHDLRKIWKLSPMDIAALSKWDDYTTARNRMLRATHTDHAPWTVIRTNDKKRGRLNILRLLLSKLDYPGKDEKAIGEIDPALVFAGPDYHGD